uniref:Uncharacterized protein n=1 Tax=Capra hircus TaxID=9925 RepID=A0A452DZR0_CAPHI
VGRDLTKTMKKVAPGHHQEVYTSLGSNFHTNKRVGKEIALILTKGCVAHLMKWIQRGPVRGVSIQPQEKEITEVDPDAKKTLKLLEFGSLSKLQVTQQPTVGMNLESPTWVQIPSLCTLGFVMSSK